VTQTFIERLDKVPLTAAGAAVTGVEGASATMSSAATFSDPNNGPLSGTYPQNGSSVYGYTASIDWGDGSTSAGTVTRTSAAGADVGTFSVSGSHAYAEEGSYTVTTTVTDAATGFTIATTTSKATVADAQLTAGTISSTCSGGSCSVSFGFTDANTAAPASDFTATIHWGDGSTSTGTVTSLGGGKFSVTGTHPGTGGAITVTVMDDGGSTVSSAASPAATAQLSPNANGVVNGNAQSGKFTVVASCGAGSTASATLNGIAVSDGQTVRLKAANKNGGSVKVNGDGLNITADSFQLVVTCTDAAGNHASSVATWSF